MTRDRLGAGVFGTFDRVWTLTRDRLGTGKWRTLTLRSGRRLTRDRLGTLEIGTSGTMTLHGLVIHAIFVKSRE